MRAAILNACVLTGKLIDSVEVRILNVSTREVGLEESTQSGDGEFNDRSGDSSSSEQTSISGSAISSTLVIFLIWGSRGFVPQVGRQPPASRRSAISNSCLGLMSVWVKRWVLRFDLWLKHLWHIGHLWGLSSIWSILCTARVRDWQNPFPHSEHLNGFSLEWMYLWSLRWSCLLNALPQISQGYGLSSVWVLSWIRRL